MYWVKALLGTSNKSPLLARIQRPAFWLAGWLLEAANQRTRQFNREYKWRFLMSTEGLVIKDLLERSWLNNFITKSACILFSSIWGLLKWGYGTCPAHGLPTAPLMLRWQGIPLSDDHHYEISKPAIPWLSLSSASWLDAIWLINWQVQSADTRSGGSMLCQCSFTAVTNKIIPQLFQNTVCILASAALSPLIDSRHWSL